MNLPVSTGERPNLDPGAQSPGAKTLNRTSCGSASELQLLLFLKDSGHLAVVLRTSKRTQQVHRRVSRPFPFFALPLTKDGLCEGNFTLIVFLLCLSSLLSAAFWLLSPPPHLLHMVTSTSRAHTLPHLDSPWAASTKPNPTHSPRFISTCTSAQKRLY